MNVLRHAGNAGAALSLLLGATLVLGCNKSEEKPNLEAERQQETLKPKPAKKPKPLKPPAPPSLTAAEKEKVPTEEDFEDEAETEISAQNLESEVDKLEQEIAQ